MPLVSRPLASRRYRPIGWLTTFGPLVTLRRHVKLWAGAPLGYLKWTEGGRVSDLGAIAHVYHASDCGR
jgi:hypothetical protein